MNCVLGHGHMWVSSVWKNDCFKSSLQFHFKVETEDFILKVEHRDFMVSLKATVEVLKTHLRELH